MKIFKCVSEFTGLTPFWAIFQHMDMYNVHIGCCMIAIERPVFKPVLCVSRLIEVPCQSNKYDNLTQPYYIDYRPTSHVLSPEIRKATVLHFTVFDLSWLSFKPKTLYGLSCNIIMTSYT